MSSIVLGIRLTVNDFQRVKIDNIDLENKVQYLKQKAAKHANTDEDDIELIYCGVILNNESSLSSCGIKNGVMVHVLEKQKPTEPPPKRVYNELDIKKLVFAFKTFTLSSDYRTALLRLSRPDVLENIIAATPGLAEDPVAVSIIKDPELIVHLSDMETIKRIAELHPALIEAASQIAAHVHEEASSSSANHHTGSTSTGYSYSLEALSDDDDIENPTDNTTSRENHPLQRNSSYNAITAAQLAAAIANATNMNFTSSGAPTPNNPSSGSGNIITTEMFTNAMQQAFASANASNAGNNTASTSSSANQNEGETIEVITTRLEPQLRQMHEMGLVNDSVNIRALQATSGDVQAAIELVFNGVID